MGLVVAEVTAGMTEDTAAETVAVIEVTEVTVETAQVRNICNKSYMKKSVIILVIFIDRREDFNRYPDKSSSSSPPADPPGDCIIFNLKICPTIKNSNRVEIKT